MKRGLNNKEKKTMAILKEKGYRSTIIETFNCKKEATYYAEVIELKAWISLASPGDLSDIPSRVKPLFINGD